MTLRYLLSLLLSAAIVLAGCSQHSAKQADEQLRVETTTVGRSLPQSDADFDPTNFTLPMPGVDGGPTLPELPQPSGVGHPVPPPFPELPGRADGPRLPPPPDVDNLPFELQLPALPKSLEFPGAVEPDVSLPASGEQQVQGS